MRNLPTTALACVLLSAGALAGGQSSAAGDFAPDWRDHWQIEQLGGNEARLEVVAEAGDRVLRVDSEGAATAVLHRLGADADTRRVSWRWKVSGSLAAGGDERERRADDYAARLFLIFGDGDLDRDTRALCYVWAGSRSIGSSYRSPVVEGVMTIVLQSGDELAGRWRHESRDFVADYRRAFGAEPGPVAAVALMSDTDDTGSRVTAWYDDVRLQSTRWPGETWEVSSPAEEGLDPAPLERLLEQAANGAFGYVDRILVVRHGAKVVDRRFEHDYVRASDGRDLEPHPYNYNHPDWHPFYRGSELHTLQSITKSVTSALIGVALDRGEIAGTNVRVLPLFREHEPANLDDRKRDIQLIDLLEMRSGIEWHESDRPIGPTNTTIQLEAADDWIAFTLDQPMDAAPGERWVYNSGGSQLLSGILRRTTGVHAHDYAERHLFGPIGIRAYHWKRTPRGFADTEGGLYLRAEDLARFGYLFLRDGEWDGERVISREWVRMSTARIIDDVNPASARDDRGYGFQWWRLDQGGVDIWAGLGYGGQFLLVIPDHDIVAVANSWNIFGPQRSVLTPLIGALLRSAGAGRP